MKSNFNGNYIQLNLNCFYPLCLYSSGLNTLYQGEAELNKLLKLVLTEGGYKNTNLDTNALTGLIRVFLIICLFACDVKVKGTVACLSFVMSSSPTCQTSCRRIDLGVRKMTTTGNLLSYSIFNDSF